MKHLIDLNSCRICLGQNKLTNLFNSDEKICISEKIMFCASVQISKEDLLPKKICKLCKLYLDYAFNFKTICEKTNAQLLQLIEEENVEIANKQAEDFIGLEFDTIDEEFIQEIEIDDEIMEKGDKIAELIEEKIQSPVGRHIARKNAGQHPRKLCQINSELIYEHEIPLNSEETVIAEFESKPKQDQRLSARLKDRKENKKCESDNETNEKHMCKICKKKFPFQSHLLRHVNMHSDLKQYKCKKCGHTFKNRYNLSIHTKRHTGDFTLKCKICLKGFSSPSVLSRHMITHTGELAYECQYCDKTFAHKASLKVHEDMHVNKKTYPCHICFKVFAHKNTLSDHMKSHLGIKDHKCHVCNRAFTRKSILVRHLKNCCKNKFKCKICDKTCDTNESYLTHLKIHGKYKCAECNVAFMSKNMLNNHNKKHKT